MESQGFPMSGPPGIFNIFQLQGFYNNCEILRDCYYKAYACFQSNKILTFNFCVSGRPWLMTIVRDYWNQDNGYIQSESSRKYSAYLA